ncbi:hypothetical protein Vadar_000887 [Vaccinium darrowii]|uniref:Uncharacterized protein n=1 Tax=Vaccinium darrowii TaxID=229202 RepID=A0ACB7Y4L4_9ERIC|nr:hypothetical protein Vadar_000887 [Vaccinium darrowii]
MLAALPSLGLCSLQLSIITSYQPMKRLPKLESLLILSKSTVQRRFVILHGRSSRGFEAKMGMKEPPVVGVMKPGAAGLAGLAKKAPTAAKEEKKPGKAVFELKLESYDATSKINEIKSFTDLGMKEAKDLVEKTPAVFKKGVSKEEAEQIIDKIKAVGGKVVME